MTLTLRYAAQSDRGLIRDGNQDSVYAGPRLLAVADGMGGMAAGDVASNIVIGAMAPLDEDVPGDALVDALRHAVGTANQQLRDTVDANPQLEGMGTTLTAVLFSGSKIGMVHIGDSRAYMVRNGWSTRAGSVRRRRAAIRNARCSPGRWTAATSTRSIRCARCSGATAI
jgi:protein phosphatase